MAQQQLHHAQIGAVVDQMGGEGVAQAVGAEPGNACGFGILFHNHPRELAADAGALLADKQFIDDAAFGKLGAGVGKIVRNPVGGFLPQRHDALLVAFAYGVDEAALEVDFADFELHRFGNAQAAGVNQLEQGFIAQAVGGGDVGGGEQGVDLGFGNQLGQILGRVRCMQPLGGIIGALFGVGEPAVKAFAGRQGAGLRARLLVGVVNGGGQIGVLGAEPVEMVQRQARGDFFEVVPVGLERVLAQSRLQP